MKVALIGGGNIGSSVVKGLVKSGIVQPEDMTVTNIIMEAIQPLKEEFGVRITTDNRQAIRDSEIVIVALKPYVGPRVLEELKDFFEPGRHILISFISGKTIAELKAIVGNIPLFRVMPNTAAEFCESLTAVAQAGESEENKAKVSHLFSKMGLCIEIPETMMPAVTVLASCGTAFALRFMRAMAQGGIEIGFSSAQAHQIASQVMLGAAKLILETGHHPEREIDKVCTPKGVTITAINTMEHNGFSSSVIKGIIAGYDLVSGNESK